MTLRVVKVGTSLLRGQKGQTTADVIDQLTTALAESLDRGDRAVLVSSGAVGLGCWRTWTLAWVTSVAPRVVIAPRRDG